MGVLLDGYQCDFADLGDGGVFWGVVEGDFQGGEGAEVRGFVGICVIWIGSVYTNWGDVDLCRFSGRQ